MDSRTFIDLIEDERKRRGIKIMPFAKLVGIQRSHYYSLIKGGGIGLDMASKMAGAFGWSIGVSKDGITVPAVTPKQATDKQQINITINI